MIGLGPNDVNLQTKKWQLNEVTIKNKYPLPLIQELIDKVKEA